MRLEDFIAVRGAAWDRLEAILKQLSRKGIRRMHPGVLSEMAFLYRQTAADLAQLRTNEADPSLIARVNRIVSNAHSQVYRGRIGSSWSLIKFFTTDYPRVFRGSYRFILASFFLCAVAYVMAYQAVQEDPMLVADILGGQMDGELIGNKEAKDISDRFLTGKKTMGGSVMSMAITTNNIRVALTAFALGITLGIGTVYIMIFNATMVGGIAGAFARSGIEGTLWATLLPHGALELTAIIIAGASGFIIGWCIWCPGNRTRRRALREESIRAVQLVAGLIPAFIVAGFIEGYITGHETMPQSIKVTIGLVALGSFLLWVFCFGHGPDKKATPTA